MVNSEGDHDEESPPLSEARNEGVAALRGGADLDGVGVTAEARWDHGVAALRGPGAEALGRCRARAALVERCGPQGGGAKGGDGKGGGLLRLLACKQVTDLRERCGHR